MYKILLQKKLRNCCLSIAIAMLASCSTVKKDGPPRFHVDETKIPDAVPKLEPHSKYGNRASYRVFGKPYHVLASSKNYEERGVASWYGSKFHAQRTSNGELYDMLKMTAAHKSLPLPTYVQVTNLSNGKKVIVKVNDRGPFEGDRLIDLSYVAAKKLGMLGHGTAYVDVKAIDPLDYDKNGRANPLHTSDFYIAENRAFIPTTDHAAQPKPVRNLQYASKASAAHPTIPVLYLQVGAFKNKTLAVQMKTRLHGMFSSSIRVTQLGKDAQKLYRVQIGPLSDPGTAHRITQQLKAIGLNSKQIADKLEV